MSKRINYAAAADFLGIPVGTLRSMVCRKQVPHIRLTANTTVFDTGELDAWKPTLGERIERTMQQEINDKKAGRDLYVVFCSVTRLCKIGRANDPHKRLRDMQIGSPTRLILWCHGPFLGDKEPRLHSALAEFRMHGEWFSPTVTERIAARVPRGDIDSLSSFVEEMCAIARLRKRVADRAKRTDRRGTFEWRGKWRPK